MLRQGQTFTMSGRRWRVAYVNASRAHCVSKVAQTVTVRDRRSGQDRTFTAHHKTTIDISPNSGIDVLAALQQEAR